MTDIIDQIDAVLADVTSCQCGCGVPLSERGPSPWFLDELHQSRWDQRQVKAKSGIEEESVPASPAPLLTLDDVAVARFELRERSPEDRIAYLAEQRARHVAMGAPPAWLEAFDALAAEQCPPAERLHPTLAEMNAASAAVRARQGVRGRVEPDGPIHPGPGTFRPLGELHLRPGAEPQAYWPTEEADPELWTACNPSLGLPVTIAVDISENGTGAIAARDGNGHIYLAAVSPPVDAALEPETAPTFTQSELDDLRRRERLSLECAAHRPRCSGCDGAAQVDWGPCLHDCHEAEQIPVAPWWRRMLGGAR